MKRNVYAYVITAMLSLSLIFAVASAASASAGNVARNVCGGQAVYLRSSTAWNAAFPGNSRQTKLQIRVGDSANTVYRYDLSTGKETKMNVSIYEKTESGWMCKSELSGEYNVQETGYLCEANGEVKTFVLPGRGVEYKAVVTPAITSSSKVMNVCCADDIRDITVAVVAHGTVVSQ